MNIYYKSIALISLISISTNALAINKNQPYKPTEIKKSHMLKGVKAMTMKQVSAIPTVVVEMKDGADKYNYVNPNQSFSTQANVSINCRLTNGVKSIYAGITPIDKYYSAAQSDKPQNFEYFDHKTTSGYKKTRNVTLTLNGKIKKALSKVAIKQCNSNLANRDLSKDAVFNWAQVGYPNMLATHVTAWCTSNYGQVSQAVKVNYKCKAQPPKPLVPSIKKQLIVNSVALKTPVKNYVGQCPKKLIFSGNIKTNGANKNLRYRFNNHFKVSTPWKSFNSVKNNYMVNHSVTLENIKQTPNSPNTLKQLNNGGMNVQSKKNQDMLFLELEVENLKTHKIQKAKETYSFKCAERVKPVPQRQKQPDLVVLGKTIKLANKLVKGSSQSLSLVIGTDKAISKSNGLCKFRMGYDIKNVGKGSAKPAFTNQVKNNQASLFISPTTQLKPNKTKSLNELATLKPGKHILSIKTDHANKVKESNEHNNLVRVTVEVKGECGTQSAARARP